jgi:hypothetical protein
MLTKKAALSWEEKRKGKFSDKNPTNIERNSFGDTWEMKKFAFLEKGENKVYCKN